MSPHIVLIKKQWAESALHLVMESELEAFEYCGDVCVNWKMIRIKKVARVQRKRWFCEGWLNS